LWLYLLILLAKHERLLWVETEDTVGLL
jgi:hypothetical protein